MAVTQFMDITWSYIMDSLQNVKSLKIFKDFVVQGQGQKQGLVNWSSRIFEDKDFPRGLHRWKFLLKGNLTSYSVVFYNCLNVTLAVFYYVMLTMLTTVSQLFPITHISIMYSWHLRYYCINFLFLFGTSFDGLTPFWFPATYGK